MTSREPFKWKTVLQRSDGEVIEADFEAHWSPERVESQSVAEAAAAQATVMSGKRDDGQYRHAFAPISAQLVAA